MLAQIMKALEELGLDQNTALRVLMSADDRLEKVKVLLGITGTDQDDALAFVLAMIEDMILSYTNQETLPKQLDKVLVVMAVSYYKAAGLGSDQTSVGPVSSVKRGDVTTSFATPSGASGSAQTFNLGNSDGDFFGWRTTLNQFRKLGW